MAVFTPSPPPVAPVAAVAPSPSQRHERTAPQVRPQTAQAVDPAGESERPAQSGRRGHLVDIAV